MSINPCTGCEGDSSLSDDKQDMLRAQIGADIEELLEAIGEMNADHLLLAQRVEHLEEVCAQCIDEHRGRGQ